MPRRRLGNLRQALEANSRIHFAVASSAGKKASIESSETVTSVAVPKVVIVLMKASSSSPARSRSGVAISPASRSWTAGGSPPG